MLTMKKTFFAIAGIAAALTASFSGCASAKGGEVVSCEGITFPVGGLRDSPSFIGRVYRTDMIANEDTFNFPETNCIVFEPGVRSAWHTHGGMIVMAAEGIAVIRRKSKRRRFSGRAMSWKSRREFGIGTEPCRTVGSARLSSTIRTGRTAKARAKSSM